MKTRFIIVSGLIGVGKTHFATQLAGLLGFFPIYEPVSENPYLGDFYKDPKKYAYPMQERLKTMRFRLHQFAVWAVRAGPRWGGYPGVIMDRSIYEDTIFAEINRDLGNIDDRDWDTYLGGYEDMKHYMMEPDLMIYLRATPEVCKARADQRDRPEERDTKLNGRESGGIPLSYMQRLHEGYEKWLQIMSPRLPVVQVDWSHFRPVHEMWPQILGKVEERSRFTRSLLV